MQPVALALLWHQHQPYYPDDVAGETLMPWVRLHGTKDYYGMAMHIKEVPEFRCTVNLVPSLLVQIQAYTDQGGSDRHLDVSRAPADDLSEADAHYLLDNFFMANLDGMIRPYPRYHELYLKRGFGTDPVENALRRFSPRDLRDLQVWSNLTWIHELAFEHDPDLREFRLKGQSWTEAEKQWLLEKQLDILRQIIPLHRELAESGQIELTTTPFYHPILPLLWDKRSARQAMPGCNLPKHLDSYREDAVVQIDRAVEFHKNLFGAAPVGMWPSEGSVSQEIVAAIARAGIEWIATDEEILAESTNGWISRDGHGHLRHPEMLYRPWRVEDDGKQLQIVFRDHALSDLIGFHYQRSDPQHAAGDMIGRALAIGRAVQANNAGRPALVPIILDGENCWEYYPDGGVRFLRTLYRQCADNPSIRPMRIRDYLREHPATDRIAHLFAGSWIAHNFAIWIGHHEDNTAWDLLHQTREFLRQATAEAKAPPETLKKAWEEIYIAEGSDWFWWFGDDHSSAQDALFDQLFRRHLKNVYRLLGEPGPGILDHPITRAEHRTVHTDPTGFLPVKVDGRRTYFEWISAGHYVSGNQRGTMTLVTEGVMREVFFGFDTERLMLRVDTAHRASDDLAQVDELRVRFIEPPNVEIRITGLPERAPQAKLYRHDQPVPNARLEFAVDQILELSVAFEDLNVAPDDPIHMYLEAFAARQSVDRAPFEGSLELTAPSPDFERIMWQV
jgi:alpha-amylase/alpha-mannosidase (GH57 family)